jgi:hypothetical protein
MTVYSERLHGRILAQHEQGLVPSAIAKAQGSRSRPSAPTLLAEASRPRATCSGPRRHGRASGGSSAVPTLRAVERGSYPVSAARSTGD